MHIRGVKRKIYDETVKWISKNSKSEPLSRIYSIKLNFNQDNYILKVFADTLNKLVALEAFKYTYNIKSDCYECTEIRKGNVLGAMLEMLLNQHASSH